MRTNNIKWIPISEYDRNDRRPILGTTYDSMNDIWYDQIVMMKPDGTWFDFDTGEESIEPQYFIDLLNIDRPKVKTGGKYYA